MTREETLDADRLPFPEALELCYGARTCAADLQDREASGWVEAATMQAGAFTAEGVMARAEVSPALADERRQPRGGHPGRIDLHAATR
ncbi:MAG: hypothetical protein ACRD0W_07575 [Acidimicrobiales bacterium]